MNKMVKKLHAVAQQPDLILCPALVLNIKIKLRHFFGNFCQFQDGLCKIPADKEDYNGAEHCHNPPHIGEEAARDPGIIGFTDVQIERLNEIASGNNIDVYIIKDSLVAGSNTSKTARERMTYSRITYVFGINPGYQISDVELLYSDGEYDVFSQYDKRQDANYIDLYSVLDNGVEIFIRTNYESIQESARILS